MSYKNSLEMALRSASAHVYRQREHGRHDQDRIDAQQWIESYGPLVQTVVKRPPEQPSERSSGVEVPRQGENEDEIVGVASGILVEIAVHLRKLKEEFASLEASIFETMEARLSSMEEEIRTLRSGIAAEAAAATLEQLQNPARRSKEAVIGRQASRAGMTKTDWLAHCERTGHDPAKMDKSIPNHEHKASRGGQRVDKRPRGKRKLTAAEERQKRERLGQQTTYHEVKREKKLVDNARKAIRGL